MLISTVIFVFFLFLTYALFLLASRKSNARGMRLEQRVAKALQEPKSPDALVQISRDDSIGGTAAINQLLSSLNFVRKLDQNIRQADMQITVIRLLSFCVLAGLMGGLAASTVLGPISALVLMVVAAALPLLYMKRKRKQRLEKFNAQLPDTLDLLSRSLAVGHAFSESLHQVASEMPEPIAGEFRITFEEQKLGLSTKAALDRMSERVPLLDLRLCLTAIHIQRETGGNLSEVLERVSQTIRERFKLMEDFRTMTTSSRGSAWILCAFPFVSLFLLTAVNPGYMSVLWHDPRGHYILGAAALMQFLGIVTIRRILDIRV